jgi:hypothetical protein
MDTDMEAVSEKPREGNKRSSNSYTQNCKRVGAPKRYGKDRRRKGRIHKNKIQKACTYWLAGNCKYTADDCKYLHSHVIGGSDVTFLTNLVGHDNKVGCFLVSLFALHILGFSWFAYLLCIFLVSLFPLRTLGLLICSAYSFEKVVSWFPYYMFCFLVSIFSLHKIHLIT